MENPHPFRFYRRKRNQPRRTDHTVTFSVSLSPLRTFSLISHLSLSARHEPFSLSFNSKPKILLPNSAQNMLLKYPSNPVMAGTYIDIDRCCLIPLCLSSLCACRTHRPSSFSVTKTLVLTRPVSFNLGLKLLIDKGSRKVVRGISGNQHRPERDPDDERVTVEVILFTFDSEVAHLLFDWLTLRKYVKIEEIGSFLFGFWKKQHEGKGRIVIIAKSMAHSYHVL